MVKEVDLSGCYAASGDVLEERLHSNVSVSASMTFFSATMSRLAAVVAARRKGALVFRFEWCTPLPLCSEFAEVSISIWSQKMQVKVRMRTFHGHQVKGASLRSLSLSCV